MRVPFLSLLSHRVLGADIFISYRQGEAKIYATALKARLEQKHRCFLDEEHLYGEKVSECIHAAKRSRMFVLVGTRSIFDSEFIPREIEAYLSPRQGWPRRLWRRFLPINVGGALNGVKESIDAKKLGAVWQPVADYVGEVETIEALAMGPSESVIRYIENAYNLLSASFLLVAGAIAVSAAVAIANWGVVKLAVSGSQRELHQTELQVATSMRKLSDTNRTLFLRARQLGEKEEQIRRTREALDQQREEVRLGDAARQASTASILALQFLGDLGVHPPNGKTRDNRDEHALGQVVRAIDDLRKPSTIAAEGRAAAEEAINSATADVLMAMNHSYRFRGHRDALTWLRPVGNTGLLISRGRDGRHLLWNPDRPDAARELDASFENGDLSANGRYLVVKNGETAWVLQLPDGGRSRPFPAAPQFMVPVSAVSDDGRTVLRQVREGLEVWDVASATHHTIDGLFTKAIAFRGSASAITVTAPEGVLASVDLTTGALTVREAIPANAKATLSPDGRMIVWSVHADNGTELVTYAAHIAVNGALADTAELVRRDFESLGLSEDVGFFSPSGRLLAVPGVKGRVLVFDTVAWRKVFEHTGPPFRIDQIAIDDDASRLVTVSSENFRDGEEVRVWNSVHLRPFREVWGIDATAFTADWSHERLEVVQHDAAYDLQWSDAGSGRKELIRTRLAFPPIAAAVSRDHTTVCVIDPANVLYVWRADGGLRTTMNLQPFIPIRPAISADGRRLVVADQNAVSIVDTATGSLTPIRLPFNSDGPTSVSPRGTWAVTRSVEPPGKGSINFRRATISVWRVPQAGGRVDVVTRIPSFFSQELFAAVSDDGAFLAVGQNDGAVKLYRHDPSGREEPRLLATFRPPRIRGVIDAFVGLQFTPDAKSLIIASGTPAVSSRIYPTDVRLLQTIAQSLNAVGAARYEGVR